MSTSNPNEYNPEQLSGFEIFRAGKALMNYENIEKMNELHKNLKGVKDIKLKPGDTYEVPDIFGGTVTLTIPTDKKALGILINDQTNLAKAFKEDKTFDTRTEPINKALFYIDQYHDGNPEDIHKNPGRCEADDEVWEHHISMWKTGKAEKYRARKVESGKVISYFFTSAENPLLKREKELAQIRHRCAERFTTLINCKRAELEHVDRIVCFGLGTLDQHRHRSINHHLAAETVKDAINGLRKPGNLPPITKENFFVQDPLYCDRCKEILEKYFDVTVFNSPEGFLKITENTLVISIGASAPIAATVLDITKPYGGPLAMLCDTIKEIDPSRKFNAGMDSTKEMILYKTKCESKQPNQPLPVFIPDGNDVKRITREDWWKEETQKKMIENPNGPLKTEEDYRTTFVDLHSIFEELTLYIR